MAIATRRKSYDDAIQTGFFLLGKTKTSFSCEDMRHLDLAVTAQNIEALASTYADYPMQPAATLPRKSCQGKRKWSLYSTLPATRKQSNSLSVGLGCGPSAFGYCNDMYERGDSPYDETVSITTSKMLTEEEIDILYKAHLRTKEPITASAKSETVL